MKFHTALAIDKGRSALPVPSLEKIILMTEKGTPDTLAFAGALSLVEQFQKENPDHLVPSIKDDQAELARHPSINELIERNISALQRDLASYERVRKFTLLDRQFTIEEGELTPTQKVRRKAIEERYAHIIDGMSEGVSESLRLCLFHSCPTCFLLLFSPFLTRFFLTMQLCPLHKCLVM